MRDVEATSRCVYKVLYFPFWIRSSRALVFNIESDNNVGDPPERRGKKEGFYNYGRLCVLNKWRSDTPYHRSRDCSYINGRVIHCPIEVRTILISIVVIHWAIEVRTVYWWCISTLYIDDASIYPIYPICQISSSCELLGVFGGKKIIYCRNLAAFYAFPDKLRRWYFTWQPQNNRVKHSLEVIWGMFQLFEIQEQIGIKEVRRHMTRWDISEHIRKDVSDVIVHVIGKHRRLCRCSRQV